MRLYVVETFDTAKQIEDRANFLRSVGLPRDPDDCSFITGKRIYALKTITETRHGYTVVFGPISNVGG